MEALMSPLLCALLLAGVAPAQACDHSTWNGLLKGYLDRLSAVPEADFPRGPGVAQFGKRKAGVVCPWGLCARGAETPRSSSAGFARPDFRATRGWERGPSFRFSCPWTRLELPPRARTVYDIPCDRGVAAREHALRSTRVR